MKKRNTPKRAYRLIAFKAFEDTDQDLLDWWEAIEEGQRSESIRELIRDHLDSRNGHHRSDRKSVSEPEIVPLMELARVRDDTAWIREALHDIPAYLEQVIQTVAAMQSETATAGTGVFQTGPSLSTQDKSQREANMRKKTW